MSKSPIKNSSLLTDEFVAVAADGTRVTGILDGQWVKELYDPSGIERSGTTVPVTVTELGSGHYRATWTPNALGSWALSLRNATNDLDFAADYESFAGITGDIYADTDAIDTRLPAVPSDFDEAADPVEILDSGGAAGTSAAELVTDIEADLAANHGAGAWDATAAIIPQDVRDAMKLAPTAGAPAAGSVDEHLDDILADTAAIDLRLPPDPADESLQQAAHTQTQADIAALNDPTAAEIDTELSGTHGAGSWLGTSPAAVDAELTTNHGAGAWTTAAAAAINQSHLAVAYDGTQSAERVRISAWLVRNGVQSLAPTALTITWYDEGGAVLFTKTESDAEVTGPDAQGVWLLVTASGAELLATKQAYYVVVAVTDGSGTVSTTRGVPTAG